MSQRPLVVVTDHLAEAGLERPLLENLAEIRLLQTSDEAVVASRGSDADVLLVYHDIRLSESTLAALSKVRAVIRCGVGFDNVDLEAAGRRGIVVCNVPDYGTEEVADHALLLLLALARRLLPADGAIRAGGWDLRAVFGAQPE
jgi:lactate dehydrogenase-like 2-hydroxyacid dehydrogenase